MVQAPFTEDQVCSLNEYQKAGKFHPFTCECGKSDLVATQEGWICPCVCGYTQSWAHAWMANWAWNGGERILR